MCLTYAIVAGKSDSLYSCTWHTNTCIEWLNVYSYLPVLPVDVYIVHNDKKKTYPFCRICSRSYAMHMGSQKDIDFPYFGVKYIYQRHHWDFMHCCHIKI